METTDNTPRRKLRQLTAKQQHDILQKTFTQDPYAFTEAWEDGASFRSELERFHRNMAPEDAEGDRRRLAMAAYYFGFQPGMFDYAYDNIEQFSNKANGGKQLDAWADFDRVAQGFGVQQAKPEESQPGFFAGIGNLLAADTAARMQGQAVLAGNKDHAEYAAKNIDKHLRQADAAFANWETQALPAAWKQDLTRLSGTVYNFLGAIAKGTAVGISAQARAEAARMAPGAEDLLRQPIEAGNIAGKKVRSVYKNRLEGARDTAEFVAANTGVPNDWVTNSGSISNWMRNAAVSFIGSMPSTIANLGITAASGGTSVGILYGADAYYNGIDAGMSEEKALAYGTVIGLINGALETGTEKLIFRGGFDKVSKDVLLKDASRNWFTRIMRNGAAAGNLEGLQEATETVAENVADLAFGQRGDIKKMPPAEFMKEMFRNVPEAYVNAFGVGFGIETGNYKANRTFNQIKLQEYRNLDLVNSTREALLNRDTELAPAEKELLQTLDVLNDAGDPAQIARAAEKVMIHQLAQTLEKQQNQADTPTDAETITPEESAASENAGQTLKLRQALPHDPADTARAVHDTAMNTGYTGEIVVMNTGWDADQIDMIKSRISPELRSMLDNFAPETQANFLGRMYPAFYQDGKVYVNAQVIRPSEVPLVLAHEAGLHYGIRKAFQADIDKMLDWVYADNFDTPELARIIKDYNLAETELDEDGNPIYDGDGNPVYRELSEENRRIAAEELLADLAETGGIDYRTVYADNQGDIESFGLANQYDVHNLSAEERRKLVKSWIAETGYTPPKPNWFKRMISNVRIWLHNHGFRVKHISDDDIANIIFRSAKAARDQRRSSVVKDNLTTDGGVRFMTLSKKPNSIKEFLEMPGHLRPERLDINENTSTGELFNIFKKYILDRDDIITPEGYKLKAKEGHFFSFCCGSKDGKKGFIDKASNAQEALHMVKNSEIEQEEMSGFELDRIRNIKTYIDVLTDPDFSYREEDKIVYGKKYNDITNSNVKENVKGYTSVVLNFNGNQIVPVHSGIETLNEKRLGKYDIKWYALESGTTSDSASTTGSIVSEEQLPDRFDDNISQNPENASSTDKNGPSAAPGGAMEGKRTETDKVDANAMFSLESAGSEELKLQVKAMQALVGNFLDQTGEEYARRFKEKYGVAIEPEEAKLIAALAISENKSARQKQVSAGNSARAWEYFKSFNPIFNFITEFAGDNFKLNPGKAFAGDEFTGTFIVKEFRDYSVKRRQKPNESDAKYRQYLSRRDKALAKNSGTPLDEVAQAYAREFDADPQETAEQMIDLLRHLNRSDIISEFKKYKDEQIAADNAELEALRRAAEDHQRRQIEEEAATVIQSQSVIDADWAKANSKVYIKLQELLFPGQSPTPHPSQSRIEEINAAIYSTKGDASGFIEGFRAGREAAYNKYTKELKAFREKLRSADADRVAAAREADALLRQLLPPEHYSKFARRVIGLRDITNEKARLEAFDNLKSDILAYADIIARDRNLEQFHTRLNQLGRRSDAGRKAIGVRDEPTQRQLDQIRKYALMSAAELAELVDGLQAKIEISENNTADDEISLHLALQFGAIDGKNLQEIITAREQLEELARNGKEKFNAALSARAAADEAMRQQIIIAVNGNNAVNLPSELQNLENAEATQSIFARLAKAGIWENLNLWGMFDLLDANSLGVFDKLAADTHTAARNEDSMNFRNADDLSRKINSLIGSNSPIERAGRILQWRKIQDKTGIYRLKHKKNAKRRFKYTYYELSQARYLLEEYDKNPSESILQDYQAEAIRHQLANFDNHVRKDYKSSFNDGVTEKLEKLAAEEEQKRAYDGKSEESLVCIPTPDFTEAEQYEMKLSQMQALSLWLYSKQPTVNYKLHFNGIDNNTLKQLENFLLPEVKELGKWMVKQLADDRAEISKVYEKLYFTAFPSEENYFPAVFEHIKTVGGRNSVDITQEGAGAKPMAYTPGALKQRVFHLGEPVKADALTVFQNHRMMMNHFVTHGETTRQLRAIFNNHDVRQAIINQHGKSAYQSLVNQLEAFVQGGNINADAHRFYQAVYGAWVRSKMAGNIVSGIKQTLGFVTYGQEIPAAALAKGSVYALRHPGEALEILKSSDYFNNRLRGGANAELRLLLDMSGQTAGKTKAVARKFDEILSYALRFGDAASVFLGGYATYKYHHDNLVARGVGEEQARKQALLEMEMATERTQQSSKPHMLNAAQRSTLRAITAFKSNQILLMNKLLPAILKRDGKQIKASLGALAVSSIVMTAVGNLLRKGIDFDEYEWLDYIENFAADAMSGYGFSGALGSEIIGGVLSEIKNKKFRFRGSDPLTDIGNTVFSIADMPEHLEDEDFDKVFGDVQKILTGVGMVADAVTPGNFVSNTAAVVREARRWWRLLTGANKRKPKRKKSWF